MILQETKYRGIKYRSRLEAKWAALFHHLRWDYVYDPLGPDTPPTFLVHGAYAPFFVEVTEAISSEDYRAEALEAGADDAPNMVVVGISPLPRLLDGSRPATIGVITSDGKPIFWDVSRGIVLDAWAKATNDLAGAVA